MTSWFVLDLSVFQLLTVLWTTFPSLTCIDSTCFLEVLSFLNMSDFNWKENLIDKLCELLAEGGKSSQQTLNNLEGWKDAAQCEQWEPTTYSG